MRAPMACARRRPGDTDKYHHHQDRVEWEEWVPTATDKSVKDQAAGTAAAAAAATVAVVGSDCDGEVDVVPPDEAKRGYNSINRVQRGTRFKSNNTGNTSSKTKYSAVRIASLARLNNHRGSSAAIPTTDGSLGEGRSRPTTTCSQSHDGLPCGCGC